MKMKYLWRLTICSVGMYTAAIDRQHNNNIIKKNNNKFMAKRLMRAEWMVADVNLLLTCYVIMK